MDKKQRIPYEQAQKLAKKISEQHNIKTYGAWLQLIGRFSRRDYLPFEEARAFVRKLKIKSVKKWVKIAEELALANHEGRLEEYEVKVDEMHRIPLCPGRYYKDKGWIGMKDFLGIKREVPSRFRPFKDAVIYVRNLGIKNCKEWQEYCDLEDCPKDIPHSPKNIYEAEWQGWNYFFGVGLYRQEFYINTPQNEILGEIENDITWDLAQIGGLIEVFREETDLDEDILKMYKDEPQLFLDGLREYLKKYPREEE